MDVLAGLTVGHRRGGVDRGRGDEADGGQQAGRVTQRRAGAVRFTGAPDVGGEVVQCPFRRRRRVPCLRAGRAPRLPRPAASARRTAGGARRCARSAPPAGTAPASRHRAPRRARPRTAAASGSSPHSRYQGCTTGSSSATTSSAQPVAATGPSAGVRSSRTAPAAGPPSSPRQQHRVERAEQLAEPGGGGEQRQPGPAGVQGRDPAGAEPGQQVHDHGGRRGDAPRDEPGAQAPAQPRHGQHQRKRAPRPPAA